MPQLYDWLDRCGMSFGRSVEQAPYLAQCGIMAKMKHSGSTTRWSSTLPAAPDLLPPSLLDYEIEIKCWKVNDLSDQPIAGKGKTPFIFV